MTQFEALFGAKNSQVKKNCVLLPVLQKGILEEFNIKNFRKGKVYAVGNNDDCTLIHTGIGAGFVGDAVLYLKKTPCRNIILFGSCGLLHQKDGLSIGSIVSPLQCYSHESFTGLLLEAQTQARIFYPEEKLFAAFLETGRNSVIKKVTCATIASLKLEDEHADYLIEKGVDVVDMECSAFFSAAHFITLNAIAVFCASDIVHTNPFYRTLEPALKARLLASIRNAAHCVCAFIKENLAGSH